MQLANIQPCVPVIQWAYNKSRARARKGENMKQYEKWASIEEFVACLKENGFDDEVIDEEVAFIKKSGNVEWHDDGSFTITIC